MIYSLFRKKNVSFVHNTSGHSQLKKTLGAWDLIAMGIGAVVGTGIFVLTGVHAAQTAGPAVTLSFAFAGITCVFVALIYTEVAAALPSSGGAYTYAYVSIGELMAWIVGWAAITQFAAGCTAVASGWSGYVVGVLNQMNIHIPNALTKTPYYGGIIDLPATLIILVISMVLLRGMKESTALNAVLVFVKLGAILIFLGVALPDFTLKNWENFMPFGVNGVILGAGSLFMAFTGFDAIANAAEETKNPSKNVTIGLIGSIVISALLYVLVSGMLTGITPYNELNNAEPLAYALKMNGSNIGGTIVAAGAIAGMTTVMLFQTYAATRIAMAMSRDGLLPSMFSRIHKKFATPHISTLTIGCIVSIIAGFAPIKYMGDLTSISNLVVLVFIVISAVKLRLSKPNIKRPFKCPTFYPLAVLSLLFCCYLIFTLLQTVGMIFAAWIAFGLVLYLGVTRKKATEVYIKNH